MAQITVQAKLTTDDLFAAIDQMEPAEADKVARRLLLWRAHRIAPHLDAAEAEVLKKVYQEKRPGFRERFDELNAKRRSHSLSLEEHDEFLTLTDESEAFDVQRLTALVELANLRGVSLPVVKKQLGIEAPEAV